ncbi:aminoglycoside phosphotransferase family protein [Halomonas sp. 18H]|nr:aminoglycoside phosphotransferase family protein [Halomonas sp. 18H]MCW4152147.1 aminoglycoside phosphotransferase family protein [Halomonas sp. 18H]
MHTSPLWPAERLSRLAGILAEQDECIIGLSAMPDTGLAHDHIWIARHGGADRVARIPKQSQMQLEAQANLAYQAACFQRASKSGHVPELHGLLPISDELPRGGLVVSAIEGRPAQLPEDLPAIGEALAQLHLLPLPEDNTRAPLLDETSPWLAMRHEVLTQARFLDEAPISRGTRQRLEKEVELFDTPGLAEHIDAGRCLISFDAHPGNFLITPSGKAVLVDLEKCRYSHPGFDLAHASLYTSTTWDPRSYAVLDTHQVADLYHNWWHPHRAHQDSAMDTRGLIATRRAMWLWSVTWCAKWLALNQTGPDAMTKGEDWSASLSEAPLIAHVAERARHYLAEPTIAHVSEANQQLAQVLS